MKTTKLLLLITILSLTSCNLEPGKVTYSNATLFISDKIIPETGTVGQPFNIIARAKAYNTCWFSVKVNLVEGSELHYTLVGTGNFDSSIDCVEQDVYADSTFTITPEVAGDYVITTWVTPYESENDTIVVSAK